MKKIIYVAPFVRQRYKGGIMRIAEYLKGEDSIGYFRKNNIDIEFFNSTVLNQKKNSEGKFNLANIKQALYLLFNLSIKVTRNNFDVLHFNSSAKFPLFKDQIITFIVSILTSKKIIFQIHFSGVDETFLNSSFLRSLQFCFLKRLDKIIVLSHNFKNQLISAGIPENKLFVLHNFHTINNDFIMDTNESDKQIKLLFVGSINKRKGFNDLLETLKILNIDYVLNVLGDFSTDEMQSYCSQFIANNNLKVNFHGYLSGSDKIDIISNSDILILPSYAEGFPMVIPEAMALGCAIISTNIAGIPEIVKNELNGYLIEPGQIVELAQKITYLSKNKSILQDFRKNSLIFSSDYDLESYTKKISLIYNN